MNVLPCQPPFCLFSANHHRLLHPYYYSRLHFFLSNFFFSFTITPDALPSFSSPPSETASSKAFAHSQFLPSCEVEKSSPAHPTPRGHHHRQRSGLTSAHQQHQWRADSISSASSFNPSLYSKKSVPGITDSSRCILRPPAVRLANPVNHVPRVTPVAVPHPWQLSDENLPLEAHRDAYPLLTIPERRRSRLTSSPSSLVVERSQGETESWRTSIAVPRGQRRSGNSGDANANDDGSFSNRKTAREMAAAFGFGGKEAVADNLRAPEQAHLAQDATPARPRTPNLQRPYNISSHGSLPSQSQIAPVPSNSGQQQPPAEVAEELAWGPAHPCFPHPNPHVPIGSQEYVATRIIRIRRDWMVKGDLAPTYSNLYPEILDPLLSEQEFRRVIATVNDELIKAFDPFRLRNWIDGALGLVTGWLWEDLGGPAIKRHLQNVETWIENWNREVGAKDGVRIWSLRRTAYMSLDIQIPDPKVGIIQNEDPSLPGTRPSTGVGRGV